MRLFVAVWPDESTRTRLSALDLGPTEGLRVIGPEEWHITPQFLGEVDEDRVVPLVLALGSAAASMPGALLCRLGPGTAWFRGDRVMQIPAEGLDDLAAAVRAATAPVIRERSRREPPFQGHLTIARAKGRHDGVSGPPALGGIPFTAAFEVGSFDLVASQLSDEGPRYTTMATVTLPG